MISYSSWARIFLPFLAAMRAGAERDGLGPLIVNGDEADPRDYQFFARSGSGAGLCGASLIHSDILLTAAHCQGAFNYEVLLYNSRTREFDLSLTIDAQRRNPNYDPAFVGINNDVLVLRLAEPVEGIPLVVLNSDPDVPVAGQELTAVGFGRLSGQEFIIPDTLQEAQFIYLSQETCVELFSSDETISGSLNVNGRDYLCVDAADESSTCFGDSGGPLLTSDGELVGLTSFGDGVCIVNDVPDGFARVSYFYDWIQEQICEISNDPPADCPAPSPPDPNAVNLRLEFLYDYFAHEITFAIREAFTRDIVYAGPQYVPARNEFVESFFSLRPNLYVMEVYDFSGRNGLDCPDNLFFPCAFFPEDGRWILIANYPDRDEEEVIASGEADFNVFQATFFRIEQFEVPSQSPSPAPSALATEAPSGSPSTKPSSTPSFRPSSSTKPSGSPSATPSFTKQPSSIPSNKPSSTPSLRPSHSFEREDGSSAIPSDGPSSIPSDGPSSMPSYGASFIPSDGPSTIPSDGPSTIPSDAPSYTPSMVPSMMT